MHNRSRGIECFNQVIESIKQARELSERPIIEFTLTRDSVLYLPEMVDLAEQLGVLLHLNLVYDFHGTQGFAADTFSYIRYYGKKKNVLLNLAALEFACQGGNKVLWPRCKAQETTVTYLPNGERVRPCFFNQKGRQGREDICSGCLRWPYLEPSLAIGFDRYYWLALWSKYLNQKKLNGKLSTLWNTIF
jgi:MoaA/NifB/PqqE/SkfB family radical SAM enzyme